MVRLTRRPAARCRRALIAAACAHGIAGPSLWAAEAGGAAQAPLGVRSNEITANAGRALTLVFPLENRSRGVLRQTTRVALPDGWRLLSGARSIELAPSERRAHLVQVAVPSSAAPGTYVLVLERRSDTQRGFAARDTVRVRVTARPLLTLELVGVPSFVRAGSVYTAEFIVRNRGNTLLQPFVTVRERNGLPIQSRWQDGPLAPGETRALLVDAATPQLLARQLRHSIDVDVTVPGEPALRASAASRVLVLPAQLARESGFHELTLRARVNSTSASEPAGMRSSAFSGELVGGGVLRPGGATRLDVVLRSPGRGANPFGDQDEYRAVISSPRYHVTLGDQTVALSRLTTEGRAGFGANATVRAGAVSLTGFTIRDRRGPLPSGMRGGMVHYARGDAVLLRAHLLQSIGSDSSRIASVRARLAMKNLARLDAELAHGGGSAFAHGVELTGMFSRLSYSMFNRQANSAFSGRAATVSRAARADLRVVGPLGVRAVATEDRATRTLATLARTSPLTIRSMEGTAYLGRFFSVGLLATTRATGASAEHTAESRVRVTTGGRVGGIDARASVDRGITNIAGDSTTRDILHAGLAVSGTPVKAISISGFAEYQSGARWYSPVARADVRTGAAVTLTPAERLLIRAGVSARRELSPAVRTQAGGDVALSVKPRPGHELTVQARTGAGGFGRVGDAAVRVSYSIPLGVPIGLPRLGGRVIGRVFDAESGRGVRNAMVLVGGRAFLTDDDGRVDISGLSDGTQYIQLDLGAAGVDKVPMLDLPLGVDSRKGGTVSVSVPVTRSVRISGHVRRFSPASAAKWTGDPAALEEVERMQGVTVTLRRGDEVVRRVTDAAGGYSATHLRPGSWSIEVDASALPDHHLVSTRQHVINIMAGDSGTADFAVIPRKRTLVMIDQAEVIADTVPAAPGARGRTAPARPADAPAPSRLPEWRRLDQPARPARSEHLPPAPREVQPDGRSLLFMGQSYYIVGATERTLENVALLTYGNPDMWPKLWLANRKQLADPLALRAGMFLIVPPRGPLTIDEARARDAWLRARESRP